jgi:hypothetical protein
LSIQSPTATGSPELSIDQLLQYYTQLHDIYTVPAGQPCTLSENRVKIDDVDPSTGGKQSVYCWKGIIYQKPQCEIGTICSPYSYSTARSAFCSIFKTCDPTVYVSNEGTQDAGIPVKNERGGIIVYNPKNSCGGGITGWLNCVLSSVRQSADNLLDPANKMHLILTAVVAFGALFGIAYYFGTHRKELKVFRKPKDVFKK